MSEETKPVCPHCGSNLVIRVGQQSHCNACGHEFAIDRHPLSTAAAKRAEQRRGVWGKHPPQK